MPVSAQQTSKLEALNAIIQSVGETGVTAYDTLDPFQIPFLDLIKEVAVSAEARGWWFNQLTGGVYSPTADVVIAYTTAASWPASYPEELIQYIIIRTHRVYHQRYLLSPELLQFSMKDEEVAYALLINAHVRSDVNTVETYANYPAELKGLGLDEFLFHRANIEEKLGMFRLVREDAETTRIQDETAFAITPEKDRLANIATVKTFQDYAPELRMLGLSEREFYELPAFKKVEALKDAEKLRATNAEVFVDDYEKDVINDVLSSIGMQKVAAAGSNALSGLLLRKLRSVDRKLQEDGQHFNTDNNVDLTSTEGYLVIPDSSPILNIDLNTKRSRMRRLVSNEYNVFTDSYDLNGTDNNFRVISSGWVGVLRLAVGKAAELGAVAGGLINLSELTSYDLTPTELAAMKGTYTITKVAALGSYDEVHFNFEAAGKSPVTMGEHKLDWARVNFLHRLVYDLDSNSFDGFGSTEKGTVTYLRPMYDTPKEYQKYLKALVALEAVLQFPKISKTEAPLLTQQMVEAKAIFIDSQSERGDASIFHHYDVARSLGRNRLR